MEYFAIRNTEILFHRHPELVFLIKNLHFLSSTNKNLFVSDGFNSTGVLKLKLCAIYYYNSRF